MDKQEIALQAVGDYLSHHRYQPPERDGWHSIYDIERGIKEDLDFNLRTFHITKALDTLMAAQPPKAEDTWMMSNTNGGPDLEVQYQHPEQPDGARRFYRVLSTSIEYIDPS